MAVIDGGRINPSLHTPAVQKWSDDPAGVSRPPKRPPEVWLISFRDAITAIQHVALAPRRCTLIFPVGFLIPKHFD